MSKVTLTSEPCDMPANEYFGAHKGAMVTLHAEHGATLEDFKDALAEYPCANVEQIYQQFVDAEVVK